MGLGSGHCGMSGARDHVITSCGLMVIGTCRHAMELEEIRVGMRGAMAAQLDAAQTAHDQVWLSSTSEYLLLMLCNHPAAACRANDMLSHLGIST